MSAVLICNGSLKNKTAKLQQPRFYFIKKRAALLQGLSKKTAWF